jgi:hypothetical protein
MRLNLKVPFAEKDAAKKLGARWDATRKIWYVVDKDDVAPFAKWSPAPHDESEAVPAAKKAAPARTAATGKVYVGSEYVERPRVCECPPWETCKKCIATALPG